MISERSVLQVIHTLTYIVLQVVPKELLLIQTMNATVNNVPKYQVIAYKIPGTLSEPHFEDSKVVGPEAEMSPIDPDRCSLTSLMKCIVSLYFFSIRFNLLRISSPTINYKVRHYFFFD
jgi:hypothetical protein